MMTYGDGLADVDLRARWSTSTVPRQARDGHCGASAGALRRLSSSTATGRHFTEKPQIGEGWINGGFFVLEPSVLDYIDGDDTIWERDPLERLAARGQLVAFRHDGFWQPMDTLRDKRLARITLVERARAVEDLDVS